MMGWLARNPLAALMAAVAIVLAAVIAAEAVIGSHPSAKVAAPKQAAPAEAKLLPPTAVAMAESYPETANRPLFVATRRPAPEAPSAEKNSFQKGQFVLQGVIMVGDNRVAMLREKSSGKIHRVELGRDVNGIKVADISPEEVTLAVGADREVLPLLVSKSGGAQGPATPAAPHPGGPFLSNEPPPAQPNPGAAQAAPVPGQPFTPPTPLPSGKAAVNPIGRPAEGAAALTPEELLARRRARRGQPGSPE